MNVYEVDDETHISEGDHQPLIQTAASFQFKSMSRHTILILPLVAISSLSLGENGIDGKYHIGCVFSFSAGISS